VSVFHPTTDSEDHRAAWEATARVVLETSLVPAGHGIDSMPEQFLILVSCRNETREVELLKRFSAERVDCRRLYRDTTGLDGPILGAQIRENFKISIGCQNGELVLPREGR
jgi:hypothetical protein